MSIEFLRPRSRVAYLEYRRRPEEREEDEGEIRGGNLSSASISNTPMIGIVGVARRIIRNARRRMACPLEEPLSLSLSLSFYSIVRRSNVVGAGQDPRIATEIRGMLRSGVSCGAYAPRASPSAFLHVYMQRAGSGPGFPTRAE